MNIYLPDHLAKLAKDEGLNVSELAQSAINEKLAARSTNTWLKSLTRNGHQTVSHLEALQVIDVNRDEAPTRHSSDCY